ncbi:tetratricopeptide repeat protein [Shewanella ulleungensis]|uniref:tetratricopeptide repeat protein n=1 Tax=Shewanella ulleungensis TaxID=2282699 RepID=UPI003D7B5A0A
MIVYHPSRSANKALRLNGNGFLSSLKELIFIALRLKKPSFKKLSFTVLSARSCILIGFIFSLTACQSTSSEVKQLDVQTLFRDELFTPVSTINVDDIYRLPESFVAKFRRQYQAENSLRSQNKLANEWLAQYIGAQAGGFEYRDHYTRSASETVLNRQGNCMSLVVLTAALADVLGIPVEFNDIDVEPIWDRRGGFFLVNGHVNLSLMPPENNHTVLFRGSEVLVDFLPERSVRAYKKKQVNKRQLSAMYYNNIAAEALVNNDYDKAYALVKKSIILHPRYVAAINTLAVIFRHKGYNDAAEQVYRAALHVDPFDLSTLYNLALILGEQDRLEEWAQVHKVLELARINNPFYYFDMAQQAYFDKQYQDALVWYKRAVEKADYRHEFYFGLSRAYWATGEERLAEKNMKRALALSDGNNKQRYQSKLQAMKQD